jgi:hypothetical protein
MSVMSRCLIMRPIKHLAHEAGGLGGYGLLRLLGIHLPILLVIYLMRG